MYPIWEHRRARRMLTLFSALVVALPAGAQQTAKPGAVVSAPPKKAQRTPEFLEAVRLYESLEYEKALDQFERAKATLPTIDEWVLTSFYQGITLANLGLQKRARDSFRAGLFIQPSADLPVEVSPKIAQIFQDERERVRRELQARYKLAPENTPDASLVPTPTQQAQPLKPAEPPSAQKPPTASGIQVQQPVTPSGSPKHPLAALPQSPPASSSAPATKQVAPWGPSELAVQPPSRAPVIVMAAGGFAAALGATMYTVWKPKPTEKTSPMRAIGGTLGLGGILTLGIGVGMKLGSLEQPQPSSQFALHPLINVHSHGASVGTWTSF